MHFRRWLCEGGYGASALDLYSVAARLALGWLDKAYWLIDPDADLDRVRTGHGRALRPRSDPPDVLQGPGQAGRVPAPRCHRPAPEKTVNWDYYLGPLPAWLAADVREYVAHRRRAWLPEVCYRSTNTLLSALTLSLRWMTAHVSLAGFEDLAPELWFDYLDTRLPAGIRPITANGELAMLQQFLTFVAEQGRPICQAHAARRAAEGRPHLPRDVPAEQLAACWPRSKPSPPPSTPAHGAWACSTGRGSC